jgi:hypothetical protein
VEAQGQGPKGEILEGVKVMRGSACGSRVTPTRGERTFRMHESSKPAWLFSDDGVTAWRAARVERRGGYREGESSVGRSSGALPA